MIAIRIAAARKSENRFRLGTGIVADPLRNIIVREGRTIAVEPRVMELLVYLASRAGEIVSKRELLDEVWGATVVDEAIQRAVSLLRAALGDSAQSSRIIETVPRRGYRLVVAPAAVSQPRRRWLAAGLAAVVMVAGAIIVAMSRPSAEETPATVASEPVRPVEVRYVERLVPLKPDPSPRHKIARRAAPAKAGTTPAPSAMIAPPAPIGQPPVPAEGMPAPEATPAPTPQAR